MTECVSTDDFPDSINIENVIFDQQKIERSPFEANLCCLKRITCNRASFVLTLHFSINFVVVSFSIGFLTFSSQTNYHSGVLALLSAWTGHIIPGPKT